MEQKNYPWMRLHSSKKTWLTSRKKMFIIKTASIIILLVVFTFSCYSCFLKKAPEEGLYSIPKGTSPTVRVYLNSLTKDGANVSIEVRGKYQIVDPNARLILVEDANLSSSVVAFSSGGIRIGSRTITRNPVLIRAERSGNILINGKRFRGDILLESAPPNSVRVTNRVNMEEYLAGVVGSEMYSYWPAEALKAQAIAARTYAFYELARRRNASSFDVFDSQASQVYGGIAAETKEVVNAVLATSGVVLTYNGNIFKAYFHSTCGGHTTQAYNVWQNPADSIRPLSGVTCDYCKSSPHYRWKIVFYESEIVSKFKSAGYGMSSITDIVVTSRDKAGYVGEVMVKTNGSTLSLSGNDLRRIIGYSDIKSTKFLVKREEDGFVFVGGGFGHGVGLCQYGAYGMASQGKSAEQILTYYYPSTKLIKWY